MSGAPQGAEPGVLYLVATPIGNLRDITLRALDILKSVDLLACEDTRTTLKLLNHFGIKGPRLIAFHEHNEKQQSRYLLEALKKGRSVAVVSEAGTPGISDPGAYLVSKAHEEGLPVRPIPGPSAIATALSVSGFYLKEGFLFLGFLPAKRRERRQLLQEVVSQRRPLLLFEAPHRFPESLQDLLEILGNRRVFLAREMTKRYEEYRQTDLKGLQEILETEGPLKGELTLLLEGAPKEPPNKDQLKEEVEILLKKGVSLKEASRRVAKKYGLSSKELYQLALSLRS